MCFRGTLYFKRLAEYTQKGRSFIFGGKKQLFQCRDFRKGLFLTFSLCKSTKSMYFIITCQVSFLTNIRKPRF